MKRIHSKETKRNFQFRQDLENNISLLINVNDETVAISGKGCISAYFNWDEIEEIRDFIKYLKLKNKYEPNWKWEE